MNDWMYILILIAIFGWLFFTILGIKLCLKNNAFGIVLLFITMNVIGLLIGIAIFYNKNKEVKNNVNI